MFGQLFDFYRLSPVERALGRWFAGRYARRTRSGDPHVRNPEPGQWREHFTPRVRQLFDANYRSLVKQLGYPAE